MNGINDISFPNLGLYLSNLPTGFMLFGRQIKIYAIIMGVAFFIALILSYREAKKTGQNQELYLDAFLVTVIPTVLGARLYYVIFSWDSFKNDWKSIFAIWEGGMAIYGGILTGILVIYIFSRVRKQSFGLMVDTLVPGLVLGQAMGRWGNFFNREAFGGNSDGLFAMRIPVDKIYVNYSDKVTTVTPDTGLAYIQVQPTFLYESILCFVIFGILLLLRRKKKVDGEVFLLYAVLYALGRFFIEGLRTDQLILCTIGTTPIPVSQVVAVLVILVCIIVFIVGRNKKAAAFYFEEEEDEDGTDTISVEESGGVLDNIAAEEKDKPSD